MYANFLPSGNARGRKRPIDFHYNRIFWLYSHNTVKTCIFQLCQCNRFRGPQTCNFSCWPHDGDIFPFAGLWWTEVYFLLGIRNTSSCFSDTIFHFPWKKSTKLSIRCLKMNIYYELEQTKSNMMQHRGGVWLRGVVPFLCHSHCPARVRLQPGDHSASFYLSPPIPIYFLAVL